MQTYTQNKNKCSQYNIKPSFLTKGRKKRTFDIVDLETEISFLCWTNARGSKTPCSQHKVWFGSCLTLIQSIDFIWSMIIHADLKELRKDSWQILQHDMKKTKARSLEEFPLGIVHSHSQLVLEHIGQENNFRLLLAVFWNWKHLIYLFGILYQFHS